MKTNNLKVLEFIILVAVVLTVLALLRPNSKSSMPVHSKPDSQEEIPRNGAGNISPSPASLVKSALPAPTPAQNRSPISTPIELRDAPGEVTREKLANGSARYADAQSAGVKPEGRSTLFDSASVPALAALKQGDSVVIPLLGGEQVAGKVNLVQQEAGGWARVGGELTGDRPGSFSLSRNGTSVTGRILLPQERTAYTIAEQVDGRVLIQEKPISEVICFPLPRPRDESPTDIRPLGPEEAPPILSSRPGATAVLYLDFDGEIVTDPDWNSGYTIYAQPSSLTSAQITEVWNRVKEDFWPFNINVTTDVTRYYSAPVGRRMRCIITPTDTAWPRVGGVAYVNSFSKAGSWFSSTIPCWVFISGVVGVAEAVSHEFGHTLGLYHDGRTSPPEVYYEGHGSGAVGWAPIMGVGYYKQLVQWSKGEYANANNQEDDLAIIAGGNNGFGYVADDAGNTRGSAATLNVSAGLVNQTGIISGNNDVDFFVFTVASPSVVTINASPAAISPNLDILLQLQNSAGTVLASSNPDTALGAGVSSSLPAGTYYIRVQGTGRGSVLGDGYSAYGSIGYYLLTGNTGGSTYDQRVENYDLGTYFEIFEPTPPPVFSIVNGQGLNSTRGIQPLDTQYSLNFLRKGPFDLSSPNATLEISTFFKVSRPTSSGLGIPTLQLGFARDLTATSFYSDGTISWRLYPKDTTDTGSGYRFQTLVTVQLPGMGFSWGTAAVPVLKSNNWYKATFQIGRVNSTTLSLWGTIDDYGPIGQAYLGRVDTTGTSAATGSTNFPFTPFTSDSSMYPALHGMSSGGLKIVDQTAFRKTAAIVNLGNLSQVYNSHARSATASTSPAGLTVNLTYNGSPNAPTNVGSYTVIGTIDDTSYEGSATNTLVIHPPAIMKQPLSQTVNAGDTAEFTVGVNGTDVRFQWRLNGVNLVGKTNSTLTLNSISTNQAGIYDVIASVGIYVLLSDPAELIVPLAGQPGSKKWQFNYSINGISSTPALARDGTIYVAAPGALIALNPSGSQKWSLPIWGLIWGSPAVSGDGTIYVGASQTNLLYAVNPNGTLRWQAEVPGGGMTLPPSFADDGTVLVPAGLSAIATNLVAFNTNGTIRWQFSARGRPTDAVVGYDGTIYLGSSETAGFFALQPDGTIKWNFPSISNPQPGKIAIGSDGTVYVGSSFDRKLRALRPNGALQWEYSADASVTSGPAIAEDGTIYFGTVWDGKLHAVSPEGSVKWVHALGDITYTGLAVSKQGTVYTSANDKRIIALNGNGTRKWEFVTGIRDVHPYEGRRPNLVMAPDGTIYFAGGRLDTGGVLFAIQGDSGPAESPWPMTHRDAQHTGRVPFAITNQPLNQAVLAGSNAVFQVGVASTQPCVFQWRRNGTNMPARTNASLVLTNVGVFNVGSYSCYVSNRSGGFLSRSASLTVNYPPVITQQPVSQTVNAGQNASFSIVAGGDGPLAFQWSFNGGDLPGRTSASLNLSNVQLADAGYYQARVTNVAGSTLSLIAHLSVIAPLTNSAGFVSPPAGLVNWWPAEGNANDMAGQHHGTPANAVSYVQGRVGRAFSFDGATGFINVGAGDIPPPWTACFWVNRQDASGVSAALISRSGYGLKLEQYSLTRKVGITQFGVADHVFNYTAPSGTWVHLAFVGTVSNTSLYANGVLQDSLAVSIPLPRTHIGAWFVPTRGDYVDYLRGGLDEISLYNRALDPSEIQAVFTAGNGGYYVGPRAEIILDNTDPEVSFAGNWNTSVSVPGYYGSNYRWANTAAGGQWTATYRPNITTAGYYDVYIWYTQDPYRTTNAPWTIVFDGGSKTVPVNQQMNGGRWFLIAAAAPFSQGTNGFVRLSNDAAPPVVIADAVRFLLTTNVPVVVSLRIGQQGGNVELSWPVAYSNYTLLGSPVLTGGAWLTNMSPRSIVGSNIVLTIPATNNRMFYRLKPGP